MRILICLQTLKLERKFRKNSPRLRSPPKPSVGVLAVDIAMHCDNWLQGCDIGLYSAARRGTPQRSSKIG
jgi:hypothetical protein